MTLISSTANSTIKQIRALSQRKTRAETGLFFIEGIRIVAEAVELGASVEIVIVARDLLTSDFGRQTATAATERGARRIEVTASVFESLSSKDGPQGLGAVIRQRWEHLADVRLDSSPEGALCWVALNSPQDPGNIGTILRTCDAVGAAGLVLLGDSADPYDPNAVRASMGAIFEPHLVKASFDEFVAWKTTHRAWVVGTSDKAAVDYRANVYRKPLILLMGSERQGLSAEQQAMCDMMVSIPMVGRSDSLNLAVATGVMLYEIFGQLRARK